MRTLFRLGWLLAATGCLLPVSESLRPEDGGSGGGTAAVGGGTAALGGGSSAVGGGGEVFDAGMEPLDAGPLFATVSVIELGVANAGNGGQGVEVAIDFSARVPVREQQSGVWGCKAWTSNGPWPLSANPGPVQFTSQLNAQLFPPQCAFMAGVGYVCVIAEGSGGVVDANRGPLQRESASSVNASASLTVSGTPFGPQDRGRHLRLAGSTLGNDSVALNWNGAAYTFTSDAFPVFTAMSASSVVQYAAPLSFGADETLPATAHWWLVMGAGPNPFVVEPTLGPNPWLHAMLLDTDRLGVSFAGGAGVPAFTLTGIDPADAFYLTFSTMEQWRLPFDGRPYTLGCRDDYEGCEADTAAMLEIETTDATPPPDALAFPQAVLSSTRVRCLFADSKSATIPPDYLALVSAALPTRLEITFAKVRVSHPNPRTLVLVGHGLRGVVDP